MFRQKIHFLEKEPILLPTITAVAMVLFYYFKK